MPPLFLQALNRYGGEDSEVESSTSTTRSLTRWPLWCFEKALKRERGPFRNYYMSKR